jgi:3-oxoacyl-[acyl-carrier-protein] synthase-1
MEHTGQISVFAAGDNIISSLGINTAENMENILAEKSGLRMMDDKSLYVEPFLASPIDFARIEAQPLFNKLKDYHKLEQLMIASVTDALAHSKVDPSSRRTLFILSSTKGNIDLLKKAQPGQELDERLFLDRMARKVSRFWHNINEPMVVCNACISGVLASVVALHMLKAGMYDNIIVVGGDLLSEFVISGFESFQSVSKNPCKPYDKNRDGLSMGEGVGTLILTTDPDKAAGSKPVMLAGGASSNDANHISGPSRTGEELAMAMGDALKEAGLSAEQVDMIDAHGTATVYNDEMESKAIGVAGLTAAPLLSLKGYFGHTLGASGLIETIVCIEAIRRQMIPRTLNFEELGVPVAVNVSTSTHKASVHNIVKTASGFGGCNAALIISDVTSGAPLDKLSEVEILSQVIISQAGICINGKELKIGDENPQTTEKTDKTEGKEKPALIKLEDLPLDIDKFGGNYGTFIRAAFKSIVSEPYIKFGKMDDLCRLAVTTAEYLLKDADLSQYNPRDIALVLGCHASSLDTDLRHQAIINVKEPYQPSPAVFVYTLANIMQGEICIRHKIKGENICIIMDENEEDSFISQDQLQQLTQLIFARKRAKVCITGYVDFLQGKYLSALSLVKRKN